MSEEIKIVGKSEGDDAILKLVSAVDRLEASLGRLASGNTALEKMQRQMKSMQASMTTGFAEMAGDAARGSDAVTKAVEKGSKSVLSIHQRRDVELDKMRGAAMAQYISWWDKKLSIQEKRDTELHQRSMKAEKEYTNWWSKALAERMQIQQKRDTEAHAARTKEAAQIQAQAAKTAAAYISTWDKMLAQRQSIQEKRDTELHAARTRDNNDYVKFWQTQLAIQDSNQAKQLAKAREQQVALHRIQAADAERSRNLNTNFLTATPQAQLRTAQKAQVYTQQGGNAAEKFGSAAANADVAALQRSLAQIPGAAERSRAAMERHNDIMREGHALARGLAGSLGGLWLTYGSLVPLAAGAALAASLKGVVSVGMEVERQLNFVAALEGQGVNLDSFIAITDSSLRSVTEAANAMRALAQNGLTAGQSLAVLPSILQLATVGEMDVGQAAIAVTGAVAAFGLQFTEAEHVADIFAKTAATSNTSVLAMTESMKQASTASSLFKVSIEETAGMLGLLAKINITGGAAGTAFTNLLTGLYEPTNQGKKALKELGVEIQTQSGSLKGYTQLMEELRSKLGVFNDAARVDFLGSIFTTRGVKAAELALQNLDEYKKKVDEATEASGFMAGVMRKLEDDTRGSFDRLKVAVENTFNKAFAEAAPYVQQLGLHLGDAFKQEGTQSSIANLATNVARLTGFLVENTSTVTGLVVAYAGLRMMGGAGGVIALFNAASAATVVSTAATGAATAAQLTHSTAIAAGTATTATFTAATTTQTAATVAATAATRAWAAVLMPALGALGVALGAAAALWLIFRDNTSEADKVNVQISNSIHTVTEQLDKEIERLEKSNALWDERNMRFRDPATVSSEAISKASTAVADIESSMRNKGVNPEQALKGRSKRDSDGQYYLEFSEEAQALMTARGNLEKLVQQQSRALFEVEPARALEKTRQASAQLRDELEKYDSKAIGTDSFGNLIVQNEKARDLMTDNVRGAAALREALMDPKQKLVDPEKELNRIQSIRASFDKLRDDVNGTLASKPEKVKKEPGAKSAENDRFRALLQEQQNAAQAAADIAKTTQAQYDSLYKTGEMSAIDYYNSTRDLSVKTAQERLAAFEKEEAISAMRDKRTADVVKFQGKQDQSLREIGEAEVARKRGINEFIYAEDKRRTDREAAEMKKRGDLVAAYEKENAPELAKINGNVAAGTSALDRAKAGGKSDEIALAERFLSAARAARTAWDETLATLGQTEAFQKAESAFDLVFAKLNTGLTQLQEKNGEGEGLGAIFSNALAAQDLYSSSLDDLMAKQQKLAEIANRPGATDEQKKAPLDALKQIESAGARMRGIWKNVGSEIEKSLTKAFGNGGKAAGGMINAFLDLGTRRQKMEDDLAKNSAGKDPAEVAKLQQKYAMDAASAQISAYGDMAGAAKGFFDENSRGYAAMEAAERGFRLLELAMSAESMVKKIFFKETEVAANVALNEAKIGGEAAASGASVALASTEASAWGITAVVKAIASLPFPANLAAGAATLAAVVGIGASMMGSVKSGASVTEERQKKQGTGSVLGNKDAKSESLSRALDLIAENTFQDLAISNGMLASLRKIEAGIGQFASLLVRTTGVDGEFGKGLAKNGLDSKAVGIGGGIAGGVAGAAAGAYIGMGTSYIGAMLGGPIGMALGAVLGAVIGKTFIGKGLSKVFGGKTTVEDTGFSANKTDFASIRQSGLQAYQYADVKKDGGWFRSDKNSTQKESLGAEGNRQITSVLSSLYDTVAKAGALLELNTDSFSAKLNSFVVDLGKVSLKGLTDDEIQKELTAVFSKVGDDLAQFGVGGLEQFQKVGEGYLETLVRVASNYQTVSVVMDSLGMSFSSVGMGSLEARERLIDLAGGLDEFKSSAEQFLNDFYSEEERAASMKKRIDPTLDKYGLSTEGSGAIKMFRDYVVALDTTTASGAEAYTALMAIAPAFKAIVDAGDVVIKTAKQIKDEAKDLQNQIDELTMTPAQLVAKEKNTIAPVNWGLFDKLQLAKVGAEAKELQDQLNELILTPMQLLDKERDKLDPANRALFDQIQQVKAGKEMLESALALEVRALNLSGNKVKALALERANELAAADKSRHALIKFGHALADLETARDTLKGAYEREVETVEKLRDKFKDLGKTLREFLAELDAGELSNKSPQDQYLASKAEFEKTYALAKGGDVEALERLQKSAESFLEQSKKYNASGEAYTSDYAQVKDAISKSAAYADKQVDVAKSQLAEMEKLVKGILDLNKNIISFADAMKAFNVAQGAANSAGAAVNAGGATDSIEAIYRSVLGRASDEAGKAYWEKAYKSGTSLSQIQSDFLASEEYKNLPRRAGGGQAQQGLTMVGETGPELVNFERPGMVYTADQTINTINNGDGGAATAAAIQQMKIEIVKELEAANLQRGAVATDHSEKLKALADQTDNLSRTIERNS